MKRAGQDRGEGEVEVGCSSSGFQRRSVLGDSLKIFRKEMRGLGSHTLTTASDRIRAVPRDRLLGSHFLQPSIFL